MTLTRVKATILFVLTVGAAVSGMGFAIHQRASTTTSQKASQRRPVDVDALQKKLQAATERNNELLRERNDLRDRAVAAEISAQSYKDRNTILEKQLEDLARELRRLRATAAETLDRSKDVPDDLLQRKE
jgi:hypothetical protein